MNNDNNVETAIAGLNCWASYATVYEFVLRILCMYYMNIINFQLWVWFDMALFFTGSISFHSFSRDVTGSYTLDIISPPPLGYEKFSFFKKIL